MCIFNVRSYLAALVFTPHRTTYAPDINHKTIIQKSYTHRRAHKRVRASMRYRVRRDADTHRAPERRYCVRGTAEGGGGRARFENDASEDDGRRRRSFAPHNRRKACRRDVRSVVKIIYAYGDITVSKSFGIIHVYTLHLCIYIAVRATH